MAKAKAPATKAKKSKKLSAAPSKKRVPLRKNTKAAKEARARYHAAMKDPKKRAAREKYNKDYYQKNKAVLKKKAKATRSARKDELNKRRKALRKLKQKNGIVGHVAKFFNKVGSVAKKKSTAKKKPGRKPAGKKK